MKNTGDGRRKIRIEREVQEIVSKFIIKQLRADLPGLITITRVQMPADFRSAQIFVTYFSTEKSEIQNFDVADILQGWARDIQDEIAHVLKMRYCPKLTFFNDETTEKILKIEKTLADLSKNPSIIAQIDEDVD